MATCSLCHSLADRKRQKLLFGSHCTAELSVLRSLTSTSLESLFLPQSSLLCTTCQRLLQRYNVLQDKLRLVRDKIDSMIRSLSGMLNS